MKQVVFLHQRVTTVQLSAVVSHPPRSSQIKQLCPTMLLSLMMLTVPLSCSTKQLRQMFTPRNTVFLQGVNLLPYCFIISFVRKKFWLAKQRSHCMFFKGTGLESAGSETAPCGSTSSCSLPRIFMPVCLQGYMLVWRSVEGWRKTWVVIVPGSLTKAEQVLFLISSFSA